MQYQKPSSEWNMEQRDCAGLVRFSFKEALRRHDRLWFKRMNHEYAAFAPDVNFPGGFPLGDKIFRTDYGSFNENDERMGKFSEFADARTLKNHNSTFISRDIREAESGDLLIFHQPWIQKYPYHVMIFIGKSSLEESSANDWVVYHTGESKDRDGMRMVRLSQLEMHPEERWRAVSANRHFLGIYRLKILT
jgi:uncharacterized protein